MSGSLVVYLIIAIAIILLISYAIAIYVRKRNESKLAILEEKKKSCTIFQLMMKLKL